MPTLSDLEEFIEENLPRNLQQLPFQMAESIQEYYQILYQELTKYGSPIPNLSSLSFPESLTGKIHDAIVSSPPPPHQPSTTWQVIQRWSRENRRGLAIVGGVLVVGISTSLAYQRGLVWLPYLGKRRVVSNRKIRPIRFRDGGIRQEAVIVLGADTPIGRSMALHLSSQGFLVLASVSSSSALGQFENLIPPSSRGYVKALVYDTADPSGSLQPFIRALGAALSLRYPLTSAGDPYARPGESVTVTGVINAIGYVAPEEEPLSSSRQMSGSGSLAGLCGLPMSRLTPSSTLELLDKHVVSGLCVLGALLPILTSSPNRSEEDHVYPATVITLVSTPASRTSLPRQGATSIVAQAVTAGVETLRRESEEDVFHFKTAGKAPNHSSNLGNSPRRPLRESSRSLSKRDVRITVVEVNSGSVWGEPSNSAGASDNVQSPTASTQNAAASPPPLVRSSSSSAHLASLWRSPASAPVLKKVSDLLLSTQKRLRPSYTVGTDTVSARWLAVSHAFFSLVPSSLVDVALTLRRQLSLRRAGLVGRAEHAFLPWSWNRNRSVQQQQQQQQQSQQPQATRPTYGPGPGPASNAHSRASLRPAIQGYEIRDSDAQSLPESERSSSGSALPSSVPSSAYGDNDDPDVEADDTASNMHSPYLSASHHSADTHSSNGAFGSHSEPCQPIQFSTGSAWMAGTASGQSSRDSNDEQQTPSATFAGSSSGTDSVLGSSWVALGESQQQERRQ